MSSSIVVLADTPVYSIQEQTILFWITKPLALLSIVCSCIQIYHLLMHRGMRLRKIYGRLWFLISFTNVLVAFFSIIAGLATPASTQVYGAFGNEQSCQVMGATFMFAFVLCMGYNAALAVFFFMSIHTKWTERDFTRKVEPWLHIIPWTYAIISVTVGLSTHLFATNDFFHYCWAATSPFNCRYDGNDGASCEYGHNSLRDFYVLLGGTVEFNPMTACKLSMTIILYRTVLRQEKKMQAKYHAKSTGNTIAKETGKQALVSFYTCIIPYGCMILLRVMELFFWQPEIVSSKVFFWFSVLAQVLFPCQGALNMICYFRPKIKERQRKIKGEESILQSLLVLLELRPPIKPNSFAAPGGTYGVGGTVTKPISDLNQNTASTGSEMLEVSSSNTNLPSSSTPLAMDEEFNVTRMSIVEDPDNDDAVNDVGYLDVSELERAAGGGSFVLGEEMIGDIQQRILEAMERDHNARTSSTSHRHRNLSGASAASRARTLSGESRPRTFSEGSLASITEHTEPEDHDTEMENIDESTSNESISSADVKRIDMSGEVILAQDDKSKTKKDGGSKKDEES